VRKERRKSGNNNNIPMKGIVLCRYRKGGFNFFEEDER